MKRILLSLTLGLFLFTVNAQEAKDALAKKILTELSEKTKTYKSMSIDFKLTIKSKEINESQAGKAQTKGTKFHYTTPDREVFCNGETVWSYIEEDNECYIDDAEDVSDFNPSEIMTIWDKNFNHQYVKEVSAGSNVHEIKLFPTNPKESKYHTIVLTADRNKKQVKKVIIKQKDGLTLIFSINKFIANSEINDAVFKWQKAKHPGVTEEDNR
jgi:outer membrane lipoprotein-sorting protein